MCLMIDQFKFTHHGIAFTARIEHDPDARAPWGNGDDGRGIVTNWINTDDGDDRYGRDWRLSTDHGRARYFDYMATCDKARREQWGIANPGKDATREEITQAAVQLEFHHLRGWCRDEWAYACVDVTIDGADDVSRSLCGIESDDNTRIQTAARELADDLLRDGPDAILATIDRLTSLRAKLIGARGRIGGAR